MSLHTKATRAVGARLAVLLAALAMMNLLIQTGFTPATASLITLITIAGGVEVSCRLTAPAKAFKSRVVVLVVIILVVEGSIVALPFYPPLQVVGTVLGMALVVVEIARRLTGQPYQFLRLSS